MNTYIIYIYNISRIFMPETKFFRLKNFILRKAGAKIGRNVKICSSTRILGDGKLDIGENTWVGINCLIVTSKSKNNPETIIKIGKNVDIAPRVFIGTGTHVIDVNSEHVAGEGITKSISIGDGCWIGVNTTILPGVKVGTKAIVAAGALVNKDLDKMSIFGGVPARFIKEI